MENKQCNCHCIGAQEHSIISFSLFLVCNKLCNSVPHQSRHLVFLRCNTAGGSVFLWLITIMSSPIWKDEKIRSLDEEETLKKRDVWENVMFVKTDERLPKRGHESNEEKRDGVSRSVFKASRGSEPRHFDKRRENIWNVCQRAHELREENINRVCDKLSEWRNVSETEKEWEDNSRESGSRELLHLKVQECRLDKHWGFLFQRSSRAIKSPLSGLAWIAY